MSVKDRASRVALLGFFWIAASTVLLAQFAAGNPKTVCTRDRQKESASVGQFTFRTYESVQTDDACLQVFNNGKIVFRRTLGNDGNYTLGQRADHDSGAQSIANGTDITGRAHPDMIVSFYTGGAHCCSLYYVFELEPVFKLLATLDAEDGDYAHFSLIDHQYYFLANDWNFAYWHDSFAGSPAPNIVLRFVEDAKGGSYHLALDKMEQAPPTAEQWKKTMQEARSAFADSNPSSDGIGSKLWGNMLDLIYDGHSDLAWRLFDEAWPPKRKGKTPFLSDFCSQLKESLYWPDLEGTMKSAPPACANAKPARTGM